MPDCTLVAFTCSTDAALGGPDCEYILADNPDDLTSPLADYEAIVDPTVEGFAETTDPSSGCITAIWIWIVSHLNMSPGFVFIQIRTLPINAPKRIQKKVHTTGGSGSGGG
jgi:hypothetical protein